MNTKRPAFNLDRACGDRAAQGDDYPEPACLIHDVSGEDVRGWEMAECTCTRTRVGELTAEVAGLRESGRTLGRTIDRWGALIIAATGSQDITDATGDGDWGLIEERLAEVPARMAERDELRARLDAVLALHRPQCGGLPYCGPCLSPWPCDTLRAAMGADSCPDQLDA